MRERGVLWSLAALYYLSALPCALHSLAWAKLRGIRDEKLNGAYFDGCGDRRIGSRRRDRREGIGFRRLVRGPPGARPLVAVCRFRPRCNPRRVGDGRPPSSVW